MPITPKQQKQEQSAGVSLHPDAFVEGGSLYDDFDGEILEMAFVQWDYNGEVDPPVLALAVEIHNEEEEKTASDSGQQNPFVQYYSAGDLKNFVPNDDGKEAIPVGSKTGLSKSCNAYKFLMSMVGAGFDTSRIGKRVDVFEHARFHFKRESEEEVAKQNAVKEGRKTRDGKFERRSQLLAEQLLNYAGEAGKAKGPKSGPGMKSANPGPIPAVPQPAPPPAIPQPTPVAVSGNKPKPTPAAKPKANGQTPQPSTVDEAIVPYVAAYLTEKLAANGGSHPKIGLAKDVIQWAKENQLDIPTRNKVIQALGNEAFLSTEGNGWMFDGETLTAAE